MSSLCSCIDKEISFSTQAFMFEPVNKISVTLAYRVKAFSS